MSDCLKCWDTPCTCGWDYRNMPIGLLEERLELINRVILWKTGHPDAQFSREYSGQKETKDDKAFMDYMNKTR